MTKQQMIVQGAVRAIVSDLRRECEGNPGWMLIAWREIRTEVNQELSKTK